MTLAYFAGSSLRQTAAASILAQMNTGKHGLGAWGTWDVGVRKIQVQVQYLSLVSDLSFFICRLRIKYIHQNCVSSPCDNVFKPFPVMSGTEIDIMVIIVVMMVVVVIMG
jgi:hypothetical protein